MFKEINKDGYCGCACVIIAFAILYTFVKWADLGFPHFWN